MAASEDDLLTTLSFALTKVPKATLRKIVSDHITDVPRSIAAKIILEQIRLTGNDIVRVKPIDPPFSTHACKSLDKRQ
ncbi:hypothetical protein [Parvibaculum sp.]|uniref:hypothetical protein n=1 Tax=Parvibaculum sp. TaxID=2024848 RepID=UPI00391A8714